MGKVGEGGREEGKGGEENADGHSENVALEEPFFPLLD